jgi:hypothetical protein
VKTGHNAAAEMVDGDVAADGGVDGGAVLAATDAGSMVIGGLVSLLNLKLCFLKSFNFNRRWKISVRR